MRIIKTNILLLAVFFVLFFSKPVAGLNEDTHEAINKRVAEMTLPNRFSLLPNVEFSLNEYLVNQLSFANGIKEKFNKKDVIEWLGDGGRYEDVPPLSSRLISYFVRSSRHFHDPISNLGYHYGGITKYSSIEWALLPKYTQNWGYYSWNDVMGYYKEALTSPDQNIRNHNFAETFRGLGQLMHHVQDASSPAHTRNDQHPSKDPQKNYEAWVRDNKSTDVDISGFTPVFFNGAMDSYFGGQADSMASFIDTNKYNGTNPNITDATDIGLSEYTNANFYSEETYEGTSYHYPQVVNTDQFEARDFANPNIESGNRFPRLYYLKDYDGETNNGNGYLLRAVDYLYYYRKSVGILETVTIPLLDYNVYTDYANLLLPRAIGYSAGLLNYFFRGKIEIIQIPDSDNIKIKNNSSEDMDGIFTLYYDAADGFRKQVSDGSWYLSPLQAGDTSNELIFTEPTDFAGDKQYILVFEGTLGSDYAVVGKVLSYWEPWGEAVCDNNPWVAYASIQGEYEHGFCPDLSNIIEDSTGLIGEAFTLNEGVMHQAVAGENTEWYEGDPAYSMIYAYPLDIEATKMKIKISAEVSETDYYDFGSVIFLDLWGKSDSYVTLIIDRNFTYPPWGGDPDTYILNDKDGEEQILNLADYGFVNENILYVDIQVYCGWYAQCSYSLDYIDFYTE